MGSTELLLNGAVVGKASWSFDGNKAMLWASCPYEEKYIYRIYLYVENEKRYLGVMMPREKMFSLRETLPIEWYKRLLKTNPKHIKAEVWRNLPGEQLALPLPFAFSELGEIPKGFLCNDVLVLQQISCKGKVLYKEHEQKRFLIFDIAIGKDFAFVPLFCFITPIFTPQGIYGAICLDGDGNFCPIK